jgi:addiction module RelE/StbE family toxin
MKDVNRGFDLKFTPEFLKDYKKLTSKNKVLIKKINKTLVLLSKDPFYNSLKSHKVDTLESNDVWSSRVTGDVRIIWMYGEERKLIILLETGTHSGSNKVYK